MQTAGSVESPPPPAAEEAVPPLVETFRRYQADLVGYTQRIVGDLNAARDVVQDAFLRLAREHPPPPSERLLPWLFTVCRHRALDRLRKERRMEPLDDTALATLPEPGPNPADAAEIRDQARLIRDFVNRLPAHQREAVHLKFAVGLSYREISEVTGLSIGNVGYLLHTALTRLRHQLTAAAATTPANGGRPE